MSFPTIGADLFNNASAGVTDLFAAQGAADQAAATGEEAESYTEAAKLAGQNEQFTKVSTGIQEAQQSRQITQAMGRTTAQVAGAGFANSGTALSLMRSNAQQGALAQSTLQQQGLITEAGYSEEQQAYTNMATAAQDTEASEKSAETGDIIGGVLKGAAAIAGLFAGVGGASAAFTGVSDTANPTVLGTLY